MERSMTYFLNPTVEMAACAVILTLIRFHGIAQKCNTSPYDILHDIVPIATNPMSRAMMRPTNFAGQYLSASYALAREAAVKTMFSERIMGMNSTCERHII